jgi:hypothetical protein
LIKSPDLKLDSKTQTWKLDEADLNSVPYQNIILSVKESDLPYLKNAAKVVFSGSFDTFQGGIGSPVTLYDYYGLSIKLFANVEGNVPLK